MLTCLRGRSRAGLWLLLLPVAAAVGVAVGEASGWSPNGVAVVVAVGLGYVAFPPTLVALAQFTRQEKLQADAVAASRKAFDVSESQFRGGTVNLLTVLQTEQTLFTAENTLVLVRLNKYLAASSLFQALGGGWTPDGKLSSLQP